MFPDVRDNSIVIPGKHGSYNFGSCLQPLDFLISCMFEKQESYTELAYKIRDLKKLFIDKYGRPKKVKLRFESEPDKFYYVEYSGKVPIERAARRGRFSLPLRAYDPHAYSVVDTSDDVLWGDDIPFMSDITLGVGDYSHAVTAPTTLQIENAGMLVVRPVIEITGSASAFTLTANGKSFSFATFSNAHFLIDSEHYAVMKDNQNYLFNMTGDFIELEPGVNSVSISGSNLNLNISFEFKAKYI
ncbi:phage tail protein [Bacillus cereus]|nr:phage tail protein [Bacillus cereus]